MNYYISSTFRSCLEDLLKKPKEGYSSVRSDVCKALIDMPDNILRGTNERIIQMPNFLVVKFSGCVVNGRVYVSEIRKTSARFTAN